MARYLVIFENAGGELDKREANTPADARNAALDMISDAAELLDGDMIRVVETGRNGE